MSRFFPDPAKAEENFQILDQLKDTNVWNILTGLLDPDTSFDQSRLYQVSNHTRDAHFSRKGKNSK